MIISFGWTSWSLVAGRKKCTRRDWSADYAVQFRGGTKHQAWDRSPRVHGRQIGLVTIEQVTYESLADMPDSDFEAEGFAFFADRPELIPESFKKMFLHTEEFGAVLVGA